MTTRTLVRLAAPALGACPCGSPADFVCAEDPDAGLEPEHFYLLPAASLRPALTGRCAACLDDGWDRLYPLDGDAMLGELRRELAVAA